MEFNLPLFLFIMLIPIYAATIFIPYWTRRTESFGVSIPEEIYKSDRLVRMRRQYAGVTILFSVITSAVFLLLGNGSRQDEQTISIWFSVLVAAYIAGSFLIYLLFHRKMKTLKQHHPEWKGSRQITVTDTRFRSQKLAVSSIWFIIPFVITIATLLFALLNYGKIPDQIPMQYDFSGNITSWAEKSYKSVLLMPVMQLYLLLLFLFINFAIAKSKLQVDASRPEESFQQVAKFRKRWSGYLLLSSILLTLLFSFITISMVYPLPAAWLLYLPLVLVVFMTGGAIFLSVTTGQGGSRIKTQGSGRKGEVIDRDDDQYWKLGVFYYNRQDPSVFLEKRFGVGWTNNWAHPLSWVFIIVVIGLAVLLPFLFT